MPCIIQTDRPEDFYRRPYDWPPDPALRQAHALGQWLDERLRALHSLCPALHLLRCWYRNNPDHNDLACQTAYATFYMDIERAVNEFNSRSCFHWKQRPQATTTEILDWYCAPHDVDRLTELDIFYDHQQTLMKQIEMFFAQASPDLDCYPYDNPLRIVRSTPWKGLKSSLADRILKTMPWETKAPEVLAKAWDDYSIRLDESTVRKTPEWELRHPH